MKLFESDVAANGVKLHVYRSNTGGQPLVFAHGFTDGGLCYLPFAEQLADRFEIILYDARHHGKSGAPASETTYTDRAEDLAGLVTALGLQRPGLIGHSMGAVTVSLFAGLYPDVPAFAVLEDPPPFTMLAARNDQAVSGREAWRESAAANQRRSLDELIGLSRREHPTWPSAERLPWAQSKQQFNLNAFRAGLEDPELGRRTVARIVCPLLIVTADLDRGALYPPQAAGDLAASLPEARHVSIPGAGHNIRREQPAAFLAAVQEFLDEVG